MSEATPLLHYEIHGRGPALLLVHGMLSSRAQWRLNLPALSKQFRVVIVELLGHGRSPAPEDARAYAPAHYAAEFERVRRAVGAERWRVVGQSLGAALTLHYALEYPERISAQVFTNSNSALAEAGWARAVRPSMEALVEAVRERGRDALLDLPVHPSRSRRLPAEVRDALLRDCELHSPRGVALGGLHTVAASSVRERAAELRVPTLLVNGVRERRFADHAAYAEKTIPGLERVDLDAGHAVNVEAAEGFDGAVLDFFARADG